MRRDHKEWWDAVSEREGEDENDKRNRGALVRGVAYLEKEKERG